MNEGFSIARPPKLRQVNLDENVYVPMRDGIQVAVDIYRPEKAGRYPVILSMAPYMKEMQQHPPKLSHCIEAGATEFFVPKGYIHVIAQVRGSGFSQGRYNFFDSKEQRDGYDLVEWLSQQSWCDGNVAMLGNSYFAMIQYLVAVQKPPHLKCIVPYDGMTDLYRNMCYQGGLFRSGFLSGWGTEVLSQCIWPGPVEGKLPPANFIADVLSRPNDGPYYWTRSAWRKMDRIEVPILNIVVQHGSQHSMGQLKSYPMIKAPKKLIILPPTKAGNVLFRHSIPLNEQILRWFDYWLKGIDTGIMKDPEVAIFDTGTGDWRYENEYPLKRTKWTKFHLRTLSSQPATKKPYGYLALEAPRKEKPDSYKIPDSIDQSTAGQPVLAYLTPPLKEDIRVWGPLSAVLYGSTTTILDALWVAKLYDIDPDGKVTLLSEGHLKASHKEVDPKKNKPAQPFHPFRNHVLPERDRINEYQIEMRPIFHTFKKGHKIAVYLAGDNPAYFASSRSSLRTVYAYEVMNGRYESTIYHDSTNPSHLLLPLIPDVPKIGRVNPPLSKIKLGSS